MFKRNEEGFTLIELLIVIVIIGILAGVLVTVINPARQQNRARDGGVIATINKVALSAKANVASYGVAPNGADFYAGLSSASIAAGCTAADDYCEFTVTGNALPATCTTTFGGDGGTTPCRFRYQRLNATAGTFVVYAKSWGSTNVFMYNSVDSTLHYCTPASVSTAGACTDAS